MSSTALMLLRWLRECQIKSKDDVFNKGYVFGYMAHANQSMEAWERGYLNAIANRVISGLAV